MNSECRMPKSERNPEPRNQPSSDLAAGDAFGGWARAALACGALALVWAGCSVGPNYQRPSVLGSNALPAAFVGTPSTNVGEWKPAEPSAHLPRGAWWGLFGDAELHRLETLANTNNQELALAEARFSQARALVRVARADYLPQVSGSPSYTRQRTSANLLPGQQRHLWRLQPAAGRELGIGPVGPGAPRGGRRPGPAHRRRRRSGGQPPGAPGRDRH